MTTHEDDRPAARLLRRRDAKVADAERILLVGHVHQAGRVKKHHLVHLIQVETMFGVFRVLGSGEFRGDAVRTFYGDPTLNPLPWEPFFANLLHRSMAPTSGEIAGWVNSSLDFVTLEVTLAGSLEYYNLQ